METNKGWVFVTGGTLGIGKGVVQGLCRAGYQVVFTYKSSEEKARSLSYELGEKGCECTGYRCDVTDQMQVDELAKHLIAEHGGPYAIVNNAGITRDSLMLGMDSAKWSQIIGTNLDSAYRVIQAFLPSMLAKGDGCIVQMSSVTAFKGNTGQANYAASKAGLIGMTKSLAVELGRFNIRVNAIAPGLIATEMTEEIPESKRKKFFLAIPLGRLGSVEDVSAMVEFLIGSGGRYLTGQTFVVDGGLTA